MVLSWTRLDEVGLAELPLVRMEVAEMKYTHGEMYAETR